MSQIQNNLDASRTQTFTYDELNRVKTAAVPTAWGLSFGYDIWGNLLSQTVTQGWAPMLSVAANSQNQMAGFSYDAAGNLLSDGTHVYTYDGENRIASIADAGITYSYDGDGKRVKKSSGKLYWTGTGSDALLETDGSGNARWDYVFFAGQRVARRGASGSIQYYFADHLGTSRLVTDAAGTVLDDYDLYPFGAVLVRLATADNSYVFTGKEQDSESGLDYFGARYYSSNMGRFMSPDPVGGSLADPQSLNRYTYVLNNPLRYTDPTGLYTCKDSTQDHNCTSDQDKAFEAARQQDLKSKDADVVRAAQAYGDPNVDNHVAVGFADLDKKGEGGVTTSTLGADANGNLFAQSDVTINSNLSGTALAAAVGHEGSHVADAQDVVKSITFDKLGNFKVGQDITRYQSEQRAYKVTDSILRSANEKWNFNCGLSDCWLGAGVRAPAQLPGVVDTILANSPLYRANGKPLSPTNQGGNVANITVPK